MTVIRQRIQMLSSMITIKEVVDKRLAVIDMTASIMCMENHMPLAVFGLNEENSIANALNGKITGTHVTA